MSNNANKNANATGQGLMHSPVMVAVVAGLIALVGVFCSPFLPGLATRLTTSGPYAPKLYDVPSLCVVRSLDGYVFVTASEGTKVIYANRKAQDDFNLRDEKIAQGNMKLVEVLTNKHANSPLAKDQANLICEALAAEPKRSQVTVRDTSSTWRWEIIAVERNNETQFYLLWAMPSSGGVSP